MLIGIVLMIIGMVLHTTSLTVVPYLLEGAGIVVVFVFLLLTGVFIGKNKKQK